MVQEEAVVSNLERTVSQKAGCAQVTDKPSKRKIKTRGEAASKLGGPSQDAGARRGRGLVHEGSVVVTLCVWLFCLRETCSAWLSVTFLTRVF